MYLKLQKLNLDTVDEVAGFSCRRFKCGYEDENMKVVLKLVPTNKLNNISCKIVLIYVWK